MKPIAALVALAATLAAGGAAQAARAPRPYAVAEKSIDQLTAASGGLSPTGALDIAGIKVVLDLRNQYAVPRQKLDDPYRYVDTSYFEEAGKR